MRSVVAASRELNRPASQSIECCKILWPWTCNIYTFASETVESVGKRHNKAEILARVMLVQANA